MTHMIRLAATCALLCTATWTSAAPLLSQGPNLTTADAVANGTDFQAPLLAETISFQGSAQSMTWWGTLGSQFSVHVYASNELNLAVFAFTGDLLGIATGDQVDIDGTPTDLYRFNLALPALQTGTYTVSISETFIDSQLGTWYWQQSSQGDGSSIFGLGDFGGGLNLFDLSLQIDGEAVSRAVPEPMTSAMVALGLMLATRRRRPQSSPTAA